MDVIKDFWEGTYLIFIKIMYLILFFTPFGIFFLVTKKIKKEYLNICYLIFILILIQGIVGWFMVKSGLVLDVTVSHYRLSVHLSIAFIIISTIFWLIKNIKSGKNKIFYFFTKNNSWK